MRLVIAIFMLIGCGPPPLEWYPQVSTMISRDCGNGCHVRGGVAPVVLSEHPELASEMLQQVELGRMPVWPPSPMGLPLVGGRTIPPRDVETLRSWMANPILGQPVADLSSPTRDFGRPSDITIFAPSYSSPGDELRCFLLPATGVMGAITAYRWALSADNAFTIVHHMSLVVLDSQGMSLARKLDTASGWPCDSSIPFVGSLNNSSVGPDGGYAYPVGYGVSVPADGGMILEVHFHGGIARTGVELWLAPEAVGVEWKPLGRAVETTLSPQLPTQ